MRIKVISDVEACFSILQEKDRFVCYLGAGASAEAGVKTAMAICDDIRNELESFDPDYENNPDVVRKKIEAKLKWQDRSRRYSVCMHVGRNTKDSRVEYFRKLLSNARPSFCHHAVAMLIAGQYFKSTCLSTNFDKLLETAFTQQGKLECQPIRNDSEIEYWWPAATRGYVLKLHGDYDTENVLNTSEETITISKKMTEKVRTLSQKSGMVVLGTAGNEESIRRLFDSLTDDSAKAENVLSRGLLWGVYVNDTKPTDPLSERELEDLIKGQIDRGEIGEGIAEMMERASKRDEPFCFFPVWGSGNFMSTLITATKNRELNGTAERFLDREMRLRTVFKRAKLKEAAITKHIDALRAQEKKLRSDLEKTGLPSQRPRPIFRARDLKNGHEIRATYGDITSRSMMAAAEFQSARRAVVSADDTCLSAGGGVARGLLRKAGHHMILNELQKFIPPIPHCTVAVTSGGNLPLNYIFHAASMEIDQDGAYGVTEENVGDTMRDVLNKAAALNVEAIWTPLLGAGVGPLLPTQSLRAILDAILGWEDETHKLTITIVIFDESHLLPHLVVDCIKEKAPGRLTLEVQYPL
jgi:O-acetyl-ADP-ribose deacetylase (regulator of RNase III)/NAD-dependent SIR2 family protein deacetylase